MPAQPFRESPFSLCSVQQEINHLIERLWHAGLSTRPFDGQEWAPAIDLEEYPEEFKLYAEIPGLGASAVEVTYLDGELTIRGEKAAQQSNPQRVLRHERRFGTFCRTIELPHGVDADRLSARCQNGVLEITIPKSQAWRPKSVKIEVADEEEEDA